MIRPIQYIDLLKLPFSGLKKLPNQAKPLAKIGQDRLSIPELLPVRYGFGLAGYRQTWVQTQGLRLKGLTSARNRGGPSVWEIDNLFLLPELLREEMDLLHCLSLGAGRCGVDRLFLRMSANSPCIDTARGAGFCFYERQYLFRLDKSGESTGPAVQTLENGFHPISPANEFAIFQVYNASYPLHVREAEGQTLDEWRQSREPILRRKRAKEHVFSENGSIAAWIGTVQSKKHGYLDMMARPEASIPEHRLLAMAESLLSRQTVLWCLASEHQLALIRALEDRGFRLVEEYATAVRYVTAKVKRPSLVPIGAK